LQQRDGIVHRCRSPVLKFSRDHCDASMDACERCG
jgi:hypothetical protein